MVCRKETVEVCGHTFVVERNVPFEMIPRKLLELFDFDLMTYYVNAPYMNRSCWNVNLSNESCVIVATSWGYFFPLEQTLYIHRLGIDPKYQHSLMLHGFIDKILEYGEILKATKAIMLTDKFNAWCKLINPKAELSKVRVIEREICHG